MDNSLSFKNGRVVPDAPAPDAAALEPRCATCVFFCHPPTDARAHCRFNPPFGQLMAFPVVKDGKPVMDLVTGQPKTATQAVSAYPPVQPQHWCGQWVRKLSTNERHGQ